MVIQFWILDFGFWIVFVNSNLKSKIFFPSHQSPVTNHQSPITSINSCLR
ncbi:hypothetical protein H5968_06005 [Sphaerospermopsis sp. LEGE 00249]|nr:hypothetical protein [Sphaerospermopsis sp. LEGE 00249]